MIDLPTVTLITTVTVNYENTADALLQTLDRVSFRNVVILTDEPSYFEGIDAEFVPVGQFGEFRDMCPFSLTVLPRLMLPRMGSHVLSVHWDGFPVNTDAWSDDWLQFDMIGAKFEPGSVGNTGFCLHSRRWYESLIALDIPPTVEACYPSDILMANAYKSRMLDLGMVYATDEVADSFSVHNCPYVDSFGFHSRATLRSVIEQGLFPRRRDGAIWPGEYHPTSELRLS